MKPLVSVVVPAFNEPIETMRESLQSLVTQSLSNFECILVDESTDPVLGQACRDFCASDARFVYVHPDRRIGLAASLNMGIEMARAEKIARFDSDDIAFPDRLAQQVAFLEAHPEVSVVGGGLQIIGESGETIAFRGYPLSHRAIARGMQTTTTVAHPTVMYRKHVVQQHGGYDASFRFAEDLDLWLRWINAGVVFANLPDLLVKYRQKVTRRNHMHWQFNRRARLRNFRSQFLLRRVFGISTIWLWGSLPAAVQEAVFKSLIFREQGKR